MSNLGDRFLLPVSEKFWKKLDAECPVPRNIPRMFFATRAALRDSELWRRDLQSTGGLKRPALAKGLKRPALGTHQPALPQVRVKRGVREGEMETFENSESPNCLSSSRSSDPWVRRGDWRGLTQTTDS